MKLNGNWLNIFRLHCDICRKARLLTLARTLNLVVVIAFNWKFIHNQRQMILEGETRAFSLVHLYFLIDVSFGCSNGFKLKTEKSLNSKLGWLFLLGYTSCLLSTKPSTFSSTNQQLCCWYFYKCYIFILIGFGIYLSIHFHLSCRASVNFCVWKVAT